MAARKKKARAKSPWTGASRLRKEREDRGWSLEKLSAEIYRRTWTGKAGVLVSRVSLNDYEHGGEPSATAFLGICKALDIDPWEFLP